MLRNLKVLFVLLVAVVLAVSAYAFAAANTVDATTKAGDGFGLVSGYDVTAVDYTLNGSDPSTLESVAFDVGAAAAVVKVQLDSTGGSWYGCTLGTGTVWICTTSGLSVADINQLRVVATSN